MPLIEAYYEFNQLKLLYRQGWLKRGLSPELCETVAEHILGVAVLSMWLADLYFPELDILKVIRMAMIHDFGEAYIGDITPVDEVKSEQKARMERQAIQSIFARLPNGKEYVVLWEEYEASNTLEAKLVRQADRLEMALQASIYSHLGLSDPGEFMDSASKVLETPELRQIFEALEKTLHKTN